MKDPFGAYLCLDTATIFPQAGVLYNHQWICFERFENAHAEALYEPLKNWFPHFNWAGFVYNAGPGSTLGLHSALMMIRVWKTLEVYHLTPVGHYNGLSLASQLNPQQSIIAQNDPQTFFLAQKGKIIHLTIESKDIPPNTLRFPTQKVMRALQSYNALHYNLKDASQRISSAIQWDESWKDIPFNPHSTMPTLWRRQRHCKKPPEKTQDAL